MELLGSWKSERERGSGWRERKEREKRKKERERAREREGDRKNLLCHKAEIMIETKYLVNS